MSKAPKLGKSADDIFSSKPIQKEKPASEPIVHKEVKAEQEQEELKRSRGRPVEHKEEWSKITVVLLDKQIHWLDKLASEIRLNTKIAVSRAELIRATIAAVEESELDISQLRNEKDIKNFLLEKLKK
jgi:hypothetical protein